MEGIFTEFENENSLRLYPFAAGCVPPSSAEAEIPVGVFVDAAIYPVNPVGAIYISSVSEDGVYRISDGTGVIMTGSASGTSVEFTDVSGLSRHVGTLVASSAEALAEFSGRGVERRYGPENTAFAASCLFPVVVDGVVSVSVEGSAMAAGEVKFTNAADDVVRVSSGELDDGRSTLRFDVVPQSTSSPIESIRRIICVVDGKTPFRIKRHQASYNTVVLTLDGISKDTVCAAAHRENDYEMVDTCDCEKTEIEKVDLPETYQLEEVFIPPAPGRPEGADNAFYLVVPNLLNYVNPLSITLEDGVVSPKQEEPEVVIDGDTADLAVGELLDDITDKGVVLQVPGLSGGLI